MRRFALGLVAAPTLLTGCSTFENTPPPADLLITGGSVIDGTGAAPVRRDVGITGDRITFLGDAARSALRARRTIDARGFLVTPGLIDPHTHATEDLTSTDALRRAALNHLMQGVTTVFVGNDGNGNQGDMLAVQRAGGTGVNVATFAGFGAIRHQVLGDSARAPTAAELSRMEKLVAQAMCEGALGLSAGLYYAPQSFAQTDELVALAREAATRGGVYETHLRDEGSDTIGLEAAVDEAIKIGRKAGLPVHIAHIKALGVDAHGKAPAIVAKVEAARRDGFKVTADQYPWTASGTRLSAALVPRWAQDGGREALLRRLADPELAERLRSDMTDNLRRRGGAGSLLIIGGGQRGQRLDAVARAWRLDPLAAAIRMIREGDDAPLASFNMVRQDIDVFARQSWVVASSDAVDGHPRKFGSFALRWQQLVRDQRRMSPQAFVHRASGLTASIFGLPARGFLKVGAHADVAIIDPRTYASRATYDEPELLATGVRTVVVNGTIAVDEGKFTGALAGRPIRKPRDPAWHCPS